MCAKLLFFRSLCVCVYASTDVGGSCFLFRCVYACAFHSLPSRLPLSVVGLKCVVPCLAIRSLCALMCTCVHTHWAHFFFRNVRWSLNGVALVLSLFFFFFSVLFCSNPCASTGHLIIVPHRHTPFFGGGSGGVLKVIGFHIHALAFPFSLFGSPLVLSYCFFFCVSSLGNEGELSLLSTFSFIRAAPKPWRHSSVCLSSSEASR